jgi:hypothetical protein
MAIPYVPLIDNEPYRNPEKKFTLESVGMSTDSDGFLKIEDPAAFISTLGLRGFTPESIQESGLEGFKDFDQFNSFLEKSVSDGTAFKDPSFYANLRSDDLGLLRDYNSSVSAFKEDEKIAQKSAEALGIKQEPEEKPEVQEKDGMVFKNKPDLEAPAAVNKNRTAPAAEQGNLKANLDNPAGLLAMAQNQGPINPKDKSLDAFQRSNIQKALNAQAARKIKDDIAKQRRSDRIQKIFDDREADLKESWARSRTGRMDGRSWDQLDEETKSEMRGRFMNARANSAYTDEKYKKLKGFTFDEEGNPTNVPIFDRDGLVGFKTLPQMEKEMGGEAIKVAKVDPRTEAQKREARILDEIDQEIKETGQHPFGEDPILGTNYRQEVKNREKYGPGYKQLKDQSIDLFNNPSAQMSASDFPGMAAAPAADTPSMPTSYNRSMVSPDMYKKSMQDVNDVLDSVPMPAMPKRNLGPVRPSRNNLVRKTIEYPTEPSQSGLVNGTKEYPTFSLETPAQPGPELTRTTKEYPTETTQRALVEDTKQYPVKTAVGAQQRKQTPGFGRSGKKQYNIPALDRLDPDNYDYRPDAPKHPGGGFGRSGKKQYNIPALDFLDLDNIFFNQ